MRQTLRYDEFGSPCVITCGNISVAGTAASVTPLAATAFRVPFKSKVVSASRVSTTGGTAAGPSVLLQWSTDGASWTSIGTATFGTDANYTSSNFQLTQTNLPANALLRMAIAAGTAAATHTVNFTVTLIDIM